jgi:hypothetical protein
MMQSLSQHSQQLIKQRASSCDSFNIDGDACFVINDD